MDALSRRALLAAGPLLGLAGQVLAADRPAFPPDVGKKFDAEGRVMPFVGNTIICHLPQQGPGSEFFDGLLDIYRALPRQVFSGKITPLPPSSYHMTIFGGANDPYRQPGLWPADLPLDLPIAECGRILGERLKAFDLECALPIRMRIDRAEPPASERPLTIRLEPLDAAETIKLRRLRARLSKVLGIAIQEPDAYRFHVTLAYLWRWLTPDEDRAFRASLAGWRARLAKACPVLERGAPEYCLLDDMFAFKRQFYLD
jgi:hypothetical protein